MHLQADLGIVRADLFTGFKMILSCYHFAAKSTVAKTELQPHTVVYGYFS